MTAPVTTERDLTIAEVATECATTKHTIYRAIRDGLLPAYAFTPQSTRVTRADLDAFKASGGVRPGL